MKGLSSVAEVVKAFPGIKKVACLEADSDAPRVRNLTIDHLDRPPQQVMNAGSYYVAESSVAAAWEEFFFFSRDHELLGSTKRNKEVSDWDLPSIGRSLLSVRKPEKVSYVVRSLDD